MATKIVTKSGSGAPATTDLVAGELAVDLTNKRLYTENGSAAIIELGTNPSGDVTFGDNGKAIFGAGSDLQIYHDGNHSYIEDAGTGSIKIKVGDFRVENASGNNLIKGVGDVATLHHAGAEKLATTASGIDVTGSVTADGLTASSVGGTVRVRDTAITDTTQDTLVMFAPALNTFALGVSSLTGFKKGIALTGGNDVSFYNTAGTSQALFWDASAESLGIGTTDLGSAALSVQNSAYVSDFSEVIITVGGLVADDAVGAKSSIGFGYTSAARPISPAAIGYETKSTSGGTYGDLLFATRSVDTNTAPIERLRIDNLGNVGIGVVPEAWHSTYDVLQIGSGGSLAASTTNESRVYLQANTYINASNVTSYLSTDEASQYWQNGGTHTFNVAPSGTADAAISWTTAMSIDNAGTVTVNPTGGVVTLGANGFITSKQSLDVASAGGRFVGESNRGALGQIQIEQTTTGADGGYMKLATSSSGSTSPTERVRITQEGNVGIGVVPTAAYKMQVNVATNTVSTGSPVDSSLVNISGGTTTVGDGVSLNLTNISGAKETGWRISAVTASGNNGDLVFNGYAGGADYPERMRLDASGNLLVGTTDVALYNNTSGGGFSVSSSGLTQIAKQGGDAADPVLMLNQTGVDGEILRLYKAGVAVGSVGVSGTRLTVGSGTSASGIRFDGAQWIPLVSGAGSDNAVDIGWSDSRIRNVYIGGGLLGDTLTFKNIAGSEAARFDSTGAFYVGTTTTGSNVATGFTIQNPAGATYTTLGHANATATGAAYTVFSYNSGTIGSITQSGTTAVLFNTTSDQRLKENIADADDAGSKIDSIQVRKFDWKADGSHQDYGMVAQELLEVAPEAVSAPEDPEEMMGVDYSKLVPMMLKEIQSLRARIAALES